MLSGWIRKFSDYAWSDFSEYKRDPWKKKYYRGESPTRRTDEQARRNKRVRKAKAARKARKANR